MRTSPRIALIDDDRTWRETLAEYLRDRGFSVYPAEGARRGLDVLDANDIRLAVIDFHMPDMDGLELLRRLRQRGRRVAALLLSSDDDPTLPERALAEGARAFLKKTVPPGLFLRLLNEGLVAAQAMLWLPAVVEWHPPGWPSRN